MRKSPFRIVLVFWFATVAVAAIAQEQKVQIKEPAFPEATKERQLIDRTTLINAKAQDGRGVANKLFNGKNLDGWTFVLDDKKAKMEDVWAVRDGGVRASSECRDQEPQPKPVRERPRRRCP